MCTEEHLLFIVSLNSLLVNLYFIYTNMRGYKNDALIQISHKNIKLFSLVSYQTRGDIKMWLT